MNALVKLTEQTIEGNIKEITFMKIKRDNLLSQLCEVHTNIQNAERANEVLERELIKYVNDIPYPNKLQNVDACNLTRKPD